MHHHKQEEVSSYPAKPDLTLEVFRDAAAGWNIHLVPKNFRFAPEHVNLKPSSAKVTPISMWTEKKISRVYGAWFHIGNLSKGSHTIRATLNANNHADLVLHGKSVDATKTSLSIAMDYKDIEQNRTGNQEPLTNG